MLFILAYDAFFLWSSKPNTEDQGSGGEETTATDARNSVENMVHANSDANDINGDPSIHQQREQRDQQQEQGGLQFLQAAAAQVTAQVSHAAGGVQKRAAAGSLEK